MTQKAAFGSVFILFVFKDRTKSNSIIYFRRLFWSATNQNIPKYQNNTSKSDFVFNCIFIKSFVIENVRHSYYKDVQTSRQILAHPIPGPMQSIVIPIFYVTLDYNAVKLVGFVEHISKHIYYNQFHLKTITGLYQIYFLNTRMLFNSINMGDFMNTFFCIFFTIT